MFKFQTFVWNIDDLKGKIEEEEIELSKADSILEEFCNGVMEDGFITTELKTLVIGEKVIDRITYRPMTEVEKKAIASTRAASSGIVIPDLQ